MNLAQITARSDVIWGFASLVSQPPQSALHRNKLRCEIATQALLLKFGSMHCCLMIPLIVGFASVGGIVCERWSRKRRRLCFAPCAKTQRSCKLHLHHPPFTTINIIIVITCWICLFVFVYFHFSPFSGLTLVPPCWNCQPLQNELSRCPLVW